MSGDDYRVQVRLAWLKAWRSLNPARRRWMPLGLWFRLQPPIRLYVHTASVLSQEHFRIRNDDGSESAASWVVAEDTDATGANALLVDTNYRVRFSIEDTASGVESNVSLQLRYQLNGGGWNNVNATSSVVRSFASTQFTDGADCTAQLTDPTGGGGSFITNNDGMDEVDGLSGGANLDFVEGTNDYTETEFCFQIRGVDVNDADTIDLRVERNTGVLDNYAVADATFEVEKSTAQTLTGTVFTKAPSFVTGTLSATYTIAGVVFNQAPAFVSGSVTPSNTLAGAVFTKPPSFPTGLLIPDQLIAGVLFSKPPAFPTGVVTPGGVTIAGVVFTKPPSFIPGSVLPTVGIHTNADGTGADVVNELNTTVNLYASIDDDPSAPNDTDWNNNRTLTPSQFYLLEDLPAGFDQAQAATITVRNRGQEWGSGDLKLYARLYQSDETTPLSDEVLVITRSANSGWENTQIALTGIVGGSKAIWDGARLRLRWDTV